MDVSEVQQAIADAKAAQQQRLDGLRAAEATLNEVHAAYGRSPYRRQQVIARRAVKGLDIVRDLLDLLDTTAG